MPLETFPANDPAPDHQPPGPRPATALAPSARPATAAAPLPAATSAKGAGTVYGSRGRAGLTPSGVAVFDTAVALVTAVVSALVSGSVGWLFAVPFVAVCAYTAWEVRRSDLRAALVAPPLSLLLALVVAGFFDDSSGSASAGLRAGAINVFAHLAQQAPVLVLAEAVVALIVCYRWWRSRQVTP